MTESKGYEKYNNPDPRCTYPWDDSCVGYCWSYAFHVDGDPKYEDMPSICEGCEMYKEEATP